MSDILFRPLTPDDTWTTFAIFRRSLADLMTGQGQSFPWEVQDEAEWLKWRPLFEHLEATADLAWGAELEGQLVGYARSIRRADTRELTEFFTLPEVQGRGIGRQLLLRAFPSDVAHRSILATSDSAALSRYLRHGFRVTTSVYAFGGRPTTAPAPMRDGLVARPMADVPAEERFSHIASIDDVILGARRDADHAWLATRRHGWLLMRGDRAVGYSYGGIRLGPIAALDPGDIPAAIGVVESEALAANDEPLSLTVPLANVSATDYLLGRRYRLDQFTMHLLEDVPVVAADRYILTSPPFFL